MGVCNIFFFKQDAWINTVYMKIQTDFLAVWRVCNVFLIVKGHVWQALNPDNAFIFVIVMGNTGMRTYIACVYCLHDP